MKKILTLLLAIVCLFSFASCNKGDVIDESAFPLKKCTFVKTDEEGELRLSVEVNATSGTIYYIIIKTGEKPTQAQIVAGVNYDEVTVIKAGNSDGKQVLDKTVSDLEKGTDYVLYLTVKDGNKLGAITSRTATTLEVIDLGAGTVENPFKIYSLYDLERVGKGSHDNSEFSWNTQANYVLMADIDLSSDYGTGKKTWEPLKLNSGENPDGDAIHGSFDGNGHTIKNLYINEPSPEEGGMGLFSTIDTGASIKDLTIDGVSITTRGCTEASKGKNNAAANPTTTAATNYYVGALAGSLKGTAENCHVKNGEIVVDGSRVGGLIGRMYGDVGTAIVVKNCSVVDVNISAGNRIGGIVGIVDGKSGAGFTQTLIENVLFVGNITANEVLFKLVDGQMVLVDESEATHVINGEQVGGIAGNFRGAKISNAVVIANLSATSFFGGIVGFQQKINAADTTPTSVENTLFNGTLTVIESEFVDQNGTTNVNFTVGNPSTGNGGTAEFVFQTNNFYCEGSKTIQSPKPASVAGTEVTVASVTQTWLTTNLPKFTFNLSGLLVAVPA